MPIRRDGPEDFYLEDVVRLRKSHPCGSTDWAVVRIGADIGIRCLGCGRRVLLPRRELERRMKTFVSRPFDPVDQETEVPAAEQQHPADTE